MFKDKLFKLLLLIFVKDIKLVFMILSWVLMVSFFVLFIFKVVILLKVLLVFVLYVLVIVIVFRLLFLLSFFIWMLVGLFSNFRFLLCFGNLFFLFLNSMKIVVMGDNVFGFIDFFRIMWFNFLFLLKFLKVK